MQKLICSLFTDLPISCGDAVMGKSQSQLWYVIIRIPNVFLKTPGAKVFINSFLCVSLHDPDDFSSDGLPRPEEQWLLRVLW